MAFWTVTLEAWAPTRECRTFRRGRRLLGHSLPGQNLHTSHRTSALLPAPAEVSLGRPRCRNMPHGPMRSCSKQLTPELVVRQGNIMQASGETADPDDAQSRGGRCCGRGYARSGPRNSNVDGNFDSRAWVSASFRLSRRSSLVRRPVLFLSFVEPTTRARPRE